MRAINPTLCLLVLLALILLTSPSYALDVTLNSGDGIDFEGSVSGWFRVYNGTTQNVLSTTSAMHGWSSWTLYQNTTFTNVNCTSTDGNITIAYGASGDEQTSSGITKLYIAPNVDTISGYVQWYARWHYYDGDDYYHLYGVLHITNYSTSYVPPVEPDPDYIYFDDSTCNFTDTVYVHYDRCYDPDEDGELDLGWRWGGLLESFLYAEDYLYVSVNAGEEYNGDWTTYRNVYGQKLSYQDLGNCWQSDHFLLGSDLPGWHLNATLEKRTDIYYGVYGVYGIYRGSYTEVLDSDIAYVSSLEGVNVTQPDPFIHVPDIPDYESNYTPPQPQPGNNSSVGSSFLTGYYSAFDSVIQPINNTVSGTLSFAFSPVTTLGDSVLTMNVYLNSSLDNALYYIDPASVILDAVFYAIPDKVEFLFQLALVFTGVLVILRWR